jgi:putative spermidine/putrescine transport system substrate-binding protein
MVLKKMVSLAVLLLLFLPLLNTCAPNIAATPMAETLSRAEAPSGALPPPGYDGQDWADILAEARGQIVNFYMWGGSETINTWVSGYAAAMLEERYAITLNMVPVTDIVDTVNKVLGEKVASKESDGSVDMIWINGENFRTMRQADLLFGPWAQFLPNTVYVNEQDCSVTYDFGYPVKGYESPYGKAQFVMVYDSARITEPPACVADLFAWAQANPGCFTYAAPPDFTGSAFVRQVCYHFTGGYQQFLGNFDAQIFAEKFAPCWEALNALEPSLWRNGETYPENRTRMQDLFANGEIDFDITYNPAEASSLISQGRYPQTARTFVFDEGTIANTHYLAIPFNSVHKAGAMVAANFLLSPEAQYSKANPEDWGDLTALDPALMPAEWQAKFAGLPRGEATLPDDVLAAHRLPELGANWLTAIEKGWEEHVLNDQ